MKSEAKQAATEQPLLQDLRAASRYTGLPAWTLRRLVLSGALPSVKLPALKDRRRAARRVWIATVDLDRLVAGHRQVADQEVAH
jgi:hypothetical protein